MTLKSKNSRRKFLKKSIVIPSIMIVPRHVLGGEGYTSPSDKLNIAGIGVRKWGMGSGNLSQCESENIVALCDVDYNLSTHTFNKYPKAKVYKDFRVMLENQKDIDAVIVATPDHNHAVITMMAMKMGKHVYCQKPLTHTVYEARVITEAARKYNVQTQMGNQGRSSDEIRKLKEWVDDGAIGPIRELYAWTDRPIGGNAWDTFAVKAKSKEKPPVPEGLDWDLWLGPAKYRDYHPDYHPLSWRAWVDFGTGSMGDMGCHILDPAFYALELGAPSEIQATSTHYIPEIESQTYPSASIVRMKFPKRGNHPELKLTWSDGRIQPPVPDEFKNGEQFTLSGAMLIGDNGKITHDSHGASGVKIIPEEKMLEYNQPKPYLPRVNTSHEKDWIRACKDGNPASSSFDYGGPLTEMALLGMIAIRCKNEKLLWDSENLKFKNNEKANSLLHKEYRKGWSL
ncbi:MAG: Gfo/Idh/MocA family protein [Flavobacteriales bacterium]|jgi:predicted dehydrogenase|tara:strand:+ start:1359 stop:2723 length:1365 start_codon:yes stop_codon:yes gene_type:complete